MLQTIDSRIKNHSGLSIVASAVKLLDGIFPSSKVLTVLFTLLCVLGSQAKAQSNPGDMTYFNGKWYYDKLILPDMSDTVLPAQGSKNYCKALRFHFFEASDAKNTSSSIVNDALKSALKAKEVNPTDLNALCKILSIGGFRHAGFACVSTESSRVISMATESQLQAARYASGDYLLPEKRENYLYTKCFLTTAVNKEKIEYEEIVDKTLSSYGSAKQFNGDVDEISERKLLYQAAFADLFQTIFHYDRPLEEQINFFAFPNFGAFFKPVKNEK